MPFQVDLELSVNDGESVEEGYQDTYQQEDQQEMTFVLVNEINSHLFLSVYSSNTEVLSNIIENIPVIEDNEAVETEGNNVSELEVDFGNDYGSDNETILSQDEEYHQDIHYVLNVNNDNSEFDFD